MTIENSDFHTPIFVGAGALEIGSTIYEGFNNSLPIGGSTLSQLGLIFGVAFLIAEIITVLKFMLISLRK